MTMRPPFFATRADFHALLRKFDSDPVLAALVTVAAIASWSLVFALVHP